MSKSKDNTAVSNPPIKLKHPFTTAAGAPVNQVNVRGIKVREMKQAQRRGGNDSAEIELAMVAVACDLVVEDLDEMEMIDYQRVSARFSKLNVGSGDESMADDAGTAGKVVSYSAK